MSRVGAITWIMLNPSTADFYRDDPTIRRVTRFSAAWGFRDVWVVNLFAARTTDPKMLRSFTDPVGVGGDNYEGCRNDKEILSLSCYVGE